MNTFRFKIQLASIWMTMAKMYWQRGDRYGYLNCLNHAEKLVVQAQRSIS